MRPLRCFSVGLLAGVVAACNTQNQPTPVGGSTNPTVDAGTSAPPSSGAPDAGTSGGGSGSGGSGGGGGGGGPDAGTVASDCDGLVPAALPTQVSYSVAYPPYAFGYCGLPIGDGNGVIGLEVSQNGHPNWDLVSPSGVKQGSLGAWHGAFWDQPAGFEGYGGSSVDQTVTVWSFDDMGRQRGATGITGSGIYAPDPNGGLLAVGRFTRGTGAGPFPQQAWMFNADGTLRWGPTAVTQSAVFGAGVDLLDHTVIISDGGSGNIMAQWFDANGVAMTDPFVIIRNFVAGRNTWFETAPLIGNSLALRRVDLPDSTSERRTSEWLAILPSGVSRVEAALPDWLSSHPNTQLQLIHSRRAYALVPEAQNMSPCAQSVDVISSTGQSCGQVSFTVDGNACMTRELRMAQDGTVMQMLPSDREHDVTPAGVRSCTMHFWPGALR